MTAPSERPPAEPEGEQGRAEKPKSKSDSSHETMQMWARIGFTTVLLGIVVWWLYLVGANLAAEPKVDSEGNVTADPFQRSKDILLVILPIVTTALGYWFGAQGKEKAEEAAARANENAQEAQDKLTAVVADPDLLAKAKQHYSAAFNDPAKGAPAVTRPATTRRFGGGKLPPRQRRSDGS